VADIKTILIWGGLIVIAIIILVKVL